MCYELKERLRSSSALAPFQLNSAPLQLFSQREDHHSDSAPTLLSTRRASLRLLSNSSLNEKSIAPAPLHGAELAPRSRRSGVGAAHL